MTSRTASLYGHGVALVSSSINNLSIGESQRLAGQSRRYHRLPDWDRLQHVGYFIHPRTMRCRSETKSPSSQRLIAESSSSAWRIEGTGPVALARLPWSVEVVVLRLQSAKPCEFSELSGITVIDTSPIQNVACASGSDVPLGACQATSMSDKFMKVSHHPLTVPIEVSPGRDCRTPGGARSSLVPPL